MKRSFACLASALLALSACRSADKTPTADTKPQPSVTATATVETEPAVSLLTGMRQLTLAGSRAGEGYFSRDGRYMIFQSEREPGNPFYQEYLLDLKTGVTNRLSPGFGKTTCGWLHPNGKLAMFASTHGDPEWKKKAEQELEERKNPKTRYSWNFDEEYDIYQTDLKGRNIRNLTKAKGYDAEGSYSPDGKWIAFASNRSGYDGSLKPEQAKQFAADPSYLMDIYIMRADGKEIKRLTTEPGYDGGPFFSPDGQRIVYRHFNPDGRTAEVFTIKLDGSDRRQITRSGVMSWAPFYHPSGDYLIFASNKFGHANFELFIVDADGKHDPVRVTDAAGFDGLPVFTPDGNKLVWAHSNPKGEAQLYEAEWNDRLARQLLQLAPKAPTDTNPLAWVQYLADPYFEGRATGSGKELQYAEALAKAFKSMGLQPIGKTFLQSYPFTSGLELGEKNQLTLQLNGKKENLPVTKDWAPLSFSKVGSFATGPIVFAGYGIVAAASGTQPKYDSYENLDVKDKWVMVFSGMPEQITNERRFFLNLYSRLHNKALTARQRGARGLIVIEDSYSQTPALKVTFEGRNDEAGLPVLRLSPTVADRIFNSAQQTREDWSRQLADGSIASFTFSNQVAMQSDIDLNFKKSEAHNVLGLIKVPGAKGTVIIGAHMDHLGHGEQGNSLATTKDVIHPGADDNASGVSAVLSAAYQMKQRQKSGAFKPKQNILFAFWSGEEIGILGSSYFANNNHENKLTASINLDMVGRYRDQLMVEGLGSAPEWQALIEKVSLTNPLPLVLQMRQDPYLPSDALTFYMKQIPSIMLFTGSHGQYHTPEDKPSWINGEALAHISTFAARIGETLASSPTSLVTYQKVESSNGKNGPSSGGFRLYLGTIPDYTQEGTKGVAITGTKKDSPAEKAGLLAGDVILELGGFKIGNLHDYVFCLQSLKAGEKTKVRILRAGREQELEITPQAKVQ